MKIVYCIDCIRKLGGMERVTIVKANVLAELEEMDVYVVVTDNKEGKMIHPLSSKIHLIDLDINYHRIDWSSQWNVFKGLFKKKREHKKKLTEVLHKIKPDVVVSVGYTDRSILPYIKGGWKKLCEFHNVKDYRIRDAKSFWQKIIAWVSEYYELLYINKYDKIVVLTEEDRKMNWHNNHKVVIIPNPCFFSISDVAKLDVKKTISVGRLSYQKNYASLIRAFRIVVKKYPLCRLEIYGEGDQRGQLQSLIDESSLGNSVFLKGYSAQVEKEMLNASCFVLTSIFEGLPLVLIEAMSCGLPIVSYDCPCGPKDIITDGKDGFLVPVNNEERLAERICFLIENESIRKEMGKAAKQKAEKYRLENIIPQWIKLFRELCNEKIGNY